MLPQQLLLAALVAVSVSAVPLNINLGAYSPALVVGDGEISLGSKESASELMATLASGAASKGGEGQQQGQQGAQPAAAPAAEPAKEGKPAEEKPAAKRSMNLRRAVNQLLGKRAPTPAEGQMAAVEDAMQWIKRDLQGFNAALGYAKEAMKNSPKIEMGSENAGVGLVVSPGVNVPQNSAANGAAAGGKKAKRDEVEVEDEGGDAPKMTLVAITEV
ncbi:uncharacterized protein EKO05_0007767 [Ascochyta rabiei]|uniref:Uncharacterized protein n=1 Tax=Didymella rabiei TaxID=5454 RepID=A0A163F6T9_DIDRA|nr:uncharacterized protein EKO05_0007767 [Ascochyta rabiei]KZM24178.1 hypothetical protein ST47_g4660 [Ascochyta rabiei]UPX17409.1 hypothetical protein EKO05_0007767 [Ascochyta rabiei]